MALAFCGYTSPLSGNDEVLEYAVYVYYLDDPDQEGGSKTTLPTTLTAHDAGRQQLPPRIALERLVVDRRITQTTARPPS
jgi:hypothetical protein